MRDNNNGSLIKIFVFIVFLAVVSVFTPIKDLPPVAGTRDLAFRLVYPVQYLSYKVISGANYVIVSTLTLRKAQKQNEVLREKLKTEQIINDVFEALAKENRQMRSLIGFKRTNPFRLQLIPAEVISRSPSSWSRIVFIDAGSSRGVKVGKAVVAQQGLVGRVIEVFPNASKVLLITDENCSVSVSLKKNSDIGILNGRGALDPVIKYISSISNVSDGDFVVTSGISDYFPKGIPVGQVYEIGKRDFDLFQYIKVKTAVNFSDLQYLFVVR